MKARIPSPSVVRGLQIFGLFTDENWDKRFTVDLLCLRFDRSDRNPVSVQPKGAGRNTDFRSELEF